MLDCFSTDFKKNFLFGRVGDEYLEKGLIKRDVSFLIGPFWWIDIRCYQGEILLRGVFHLRGSAWVENCTIFPQFTLPGANSEVKYSSYTHKAKVDPRGVWG